MKTVWNVLTALAAVAGIVYVIATYGDKIVAWAQKVLAACPYLGKTETAAAEETPAEETAAEETPAVEETTEAAEASEVSAPAETAEAQEAPVEEASADNEPVAEESDFAG